MKFYYTASYQAICQGIPATISKLIVTEERILNNTQLKDFIRQERLKSEPKR
jgi:hypothetical protein